MEDKSSSFRFLIDLNGSAGKKFDGIDLLNRSGHFRPRGNGIGMNRQFALFILIHKQGIA